MLAGAAGQVEQPAGQLDGGLVGQVQDVGLLAGHRAFAGLDVAAAQVDQVVPGQLPQPGVERQRPLADVGVELLVGLGQRLLHHVGWIDAGRQAAVEVQGHHLPQTGPVPAEELWAG